jgi:hypothetical protein
MACDSPINPQLVAVLRNCALALRPIANYALPPALDQHLLDLGERKEFLEASEYECLLALVDFVQDRTLEKHRAELALRQLESLVPEAIRV